MDSKSPTLAPNISAQGWCRRFRDHGKLPRPRPRRRKMLPLVDLCMLSLAENIDEVSSSALDSLLSKHLYSLYLEVVRRGLSFRSWKLFSQALPKRTCRIPLGAYSYYRDIEPPFAEDLSVYTGPLTSSTVNFISSLYIEDASCFTVSDLLTLADMRNLGVLALHAYNRTRTDGFHTLPVSDRLVRGWSDRERPFPLLRVLDLITSTSLTYHTLRYASRFPSLTYCYFATNGVDIDPTLWKSSKSISDLGWGLHHTMPPLGYMPTDVPAMVSLSPCKGTDHIDLSSDMEHRPTTRELQLHPLDNIAMCRLLHWAKYLRQGESSGDADLVHQGVNLAYRATVLQNEEGNMEGNDSTGETRLLLASRPLAYIHLRHDPGQHKALPPTCEIWFTREFTPSMSRVATDTPTEDSTGKRRTKALQQKPGKRPCLGDLLKY